MNLVISDHKTIIGMAKHLSEIDKKIEKKLRGALE